MGGPVRAHLLDSFIKHGKIPLHHPQGDILITGPGGILDQQPPFALRATGGQLNRIVIISINHTGIGSQISNAFQPGGCCAPGHENDCTASQLFGGPGHGLAVIAVGGGYTG